MQCGWNESDKMFMVHAGFARPPSEGVSVADVKLPYVGLEDFMHGEMEYSLDKRRATKRQSRMKNNGNRRLDLSDIKDSWLISVKTQCLNWTT